MKELNLIKLGKTRFESVWDIQKQLVNRRIDNEIDDCIVITEHFPVLTMGRATDKDNLLVSKDTLSKRGVKLFEIERGGDITFHGPGQLVLYPIMNLNNWIKDVRKFLSDLETVAIDAFSKLGLEAGIKNGMTGIWVDNHKVGAIGVAVKRWVTYHGMAINVNTDLNYFKLINPCGITDYPVGSLSALLNKELTLNEVSDLLVESFRKHFKYTSVSEISLENIMAK